MDHQPFKPGDRVVLTGRDAPGALTRGNHYTCGGKHWSDNPRYLGVVSNDRGNQGLWYTREFEHAGGPW